MNVCPFSLFILYCWGLNPEPQCIAGEHSYSRIHPQPSFTSFFLVRGHLPSDDNKEPWLEIWRIPLLSSQKTFRDWGIGEFLTNTISIYVKFYLEIATSRGNSPCGVLVLAFSLLTLENPLLSFLVSFFSAILWRHICAPLAFLFLPLATTIIAFENYSQRPFVYLALAFFPISVQSHVLLLLKKQLEWTCIACYW